MSLAKHKLGSLKEKIEAEEQARLEALKAEKPKKKEIRIRKPRRRSKAK